MAGGEQEIAGISCGHYVLLNFKNVVLTRILIKKKNPRL